MPRHRKAVDNANIHISNAEKDARREEEKKVNSIGRKNLEGIPKGLRNAEAIEEWRYITKALLPIDFINDLDRDNIVTYCNLEAEYKKAVTILGAIENSPLLFGTEFHQNIEKEKRYAESEKLRYAALIGLTIDSRLKIASIKTSQEQETIEEEFGDI